MTAAIPSPSKTPSQNPAHVPPGLANASVAGRARLASWLACLAVALTLGWSEPARAGRSCENRPRTVESLRSGMQLAAQTHAALEQDHRRDGVELVFLARAGQDLSKYGLRHSHMGFAYRTPDGQWRVLHKLNHCGSAEAHIYLQGLGEFFMDDPWRYESAWVVPTRSVQLALLRVLRDNPARGLALHAKPYSIVSHTWSTRYQQSNQWVLETLALALDPSVRSRASAQGWLMRQGYLPTTLRIGALTRLGAQVSQANVAFDDHPTHLRFSDRIETTTVDSAFLWLTRTEFGGLTRSESLTRD